MERDYGKEIDDLKAEVAELKRILARIPYPPRTKSVGVLPENGHIQKMPGMHSDASVMNVLSQLEDAGNQEHSTGAISYMGVFASGSRQSTWIKHIVQIDQLLALIENNTAAKVLTCIGNNDRLNILLAILKKPMTVAQLVKECGYHSTGQVYHHLKPLIAADLICEDNGKLGKGYYVVQPHRVQGIIMLLAAVSDMLDPTYSRGVWEENNQ